MKYLRFVAAASRVCGVVIFLAVSIFAQIPAPKDVIGFTPGDDRKLASWAQIVDYFQKLDKASDKLIFQEIGKTTMGKPFAYATISSAENLRQIKKFQEINAKLADPRKINSSDAVAKQLIKQGKTIVMITCGIHSTEVGSTLTSMKIAHFLTMGGQPDTEKILANTIILLVPSLNPDGVDIVKNWYDKTLGTPYEGTEPPELYHKYVGHDNNRDWYAFTQVETQLTVDKIHNVWHPQIVHDIHQQGANGSRLFLPPYMQPVEPNVPKQIVEGYTELGNFMAGTLRKMGFQGITTNSTYDAWTPARAYSHYHGGVRILSETASARLATPINVKFENLRVASDDGYDPKKVSENFGPIWMGGDWKLQNVTEYMQFAAIGLMFHAAENREKWLTRFYEVGKEAVRPRRAGEPAYYVIKGQGEAAARELLQRGGVEMQYGRVGGHEGTVIRLDQPYGGFAKALLERQTYPDLKDANGTPITPYDVTAHTLPLLMNFEAIAVPAGAGRFAPVRRANSVAEMTKVPCKLSSIGVFRSEMGNMDEGWTRWMTNSRNWQKYGPKPADRSCGDLAVSEIRNKAIRDGKLNDTGIIFPDQSAAQILNGYAKGSMPDEYVGGVGKDGVENLKKYVEAGGTLVFLNRSTQFAIEQFNLPIKDVTRGLNRKDFFIPGSILRTELDTGHPISQGMPQQSIAWFENSPAFEVVGPQAASLRLGGENAAVIQTAAFADTQAGSLRSDVRVIARYPADPKQILLSGWALGAEKIAGKAALVEVKMGKGKIVLFGFRPQYRGQSLATLPLLFNAIGK